MTDTASRKVPAEFAPGRRTQAGQPTVSAGAILAFYVGYEVGGFELGLVPGGASGTSGPQPQWGVEDAHAAIKRLLGLGTKVLEQVQEVGEGIKVAAVEDPFGNRLGIIQNPRFAPDKVR